jgi:hypothetical protein
MLEGIKGLLSYLAETFRIDVEEMPEPAEDAPEEHGDIMKFLPPWPGEGAVRLDPLPKAQDIVPPPKGQSIVQTAGNGRCDSIEMDYAARDRYEVSVNGQVFVLNRSEFQDFVSSYRLGSQDFCDDLVIEFNGKPVQDYARYTGQANHFFSLVSREFGMWRLGLSRGQKKFYDALNVITRFGDRLVKADEIEGAPRELKAAIRHSVPIYGGSGTIVRLPGGRLGIVTASHVIRRYPGDFSKSAKVKIDGKEYETESVYDASKDYFDAWGDDWAILLFSPRDARALRRAGFTGIPITAREEYPDRYTPVFALGYPGVLRTRTKFDEVQQLELSSGYLTMRPGEGPEKKETVIMDEEGEPFLDYVPDRNAVSSSSWVGPGYSGGGLFWLNPKTKRVELIGVHVYPHACHLDGMMGSSADDLGGRYSLFHAFVDEERASSLLDEHS